MKYSTVLMAAALATWSLCVAAQDPPAQRAQAGTRESETLHAEVQPAQDLDGGRHVEWGYMGPSGPEHWADLSKDYRVCARGQQESPVDLRNAVKSQLGRLTTNWRPLPLRVVDTGHALQVDAPAGSSMTVGSKSYELAQLHFHHPSEHLVNGQRFPLEIHFVHRAPDGVLGVVGVLVAVGRPNPELQRVLDNLPAERGGTRSRAGEVLNIAALKPSGAFLRYEGSLTTPPCSENVDWVVMERPIQASAEQIEAFRRVYPMNARPVQELHRRFLLQSQ